MDEPDTSGIRGWTKLLSVGRMTTSELHFCLILKMVRSNPDHWEAQVKLLPADFLPGFYAYCTQFLVPFDFMPHPYCMTVSIDEKALELEVRKLKEELKPKYEALYSFIEQKVQRS